MSATLVHPQGLYKTALAAMDADADMTCFAAPNLVRVHIQGLHSHRDSATVGRICGKKG